MGRETEEHLRKLESTNAQARVIVENIDNTRKFIKDSNGHIKDLSELAPYFAILPKSELAVERVVRYSYEKGSENLDSKILSTAIRHHLYDNVLYSHNIPLLGNRTLEKERYPVKV